MSDEDEDKSLSWKWLKASESLSPEISLGWL